jgi:hypothetical protein
MEMEEEQQQQQWLHLAVLYGMARLVDPRYRDERHKLVVNGYEQPPMDRHSLEHLVNHHHRESHEEVTITELELIRCIDMVSARTAPDGGLGVLRTFFARSDTTLTSVSLSFCIFGGEEDASQLLSAFQTNRTVTDFLAVGYVCNLRGATLGNCLSTLMQNMPQLQRLDCVGFALLVEGSRALQPAFDLIGL